MIVNAEITGVELRKTKAGGRAVNVCFKTDSTDKKFVWVRDFIGESAPEWVASRWWALIKQDLGWEGFASVNSFDLTGVHFVVELEDSAYGPKVKSFVNDAPSTESAASAPAPPPALVPQDDIPF